MARRHHQSRPRGPGTSSPACGALRAMPNPFASQAPLSSAVGGNAQAQRRNPFASSAPLASTGASAGSDGALGPAAGPPNTGPPPTSFAGGSAYHAQAHGVAHGGGMYPTPPEMTPPGHLGGSHLAHTSGPQQSGYQTQPQLGAPGAQFSHSGAVPGQGVSPFAISPAIGAIPNNVSSGSLNAWDTGGSNVGPAGPGAGPGAAQSVAGFVTPAHAGVHGAAPTLFVPASASPETRNAPGLLDTGRSGLAPPANHAARPMPSVLGVGGSVPGGGAGGGPGGPPPAAPISLRGRERYCSGGAWVGPAPEWPRPPADATVAGADVSGVLPKHALIVQHVRRKHAELLRSSAGARRREVESLDAKLGGMLLFLNAGEGETHISAPVAEALLGLCTAAEQNDTPNVNAYLLHISTHYWEEVSYWFPALKRLVRL